MSDIKVFTVSTFDGIKIDKYIKPVTYHVVIGMNFFADFIQSFTDFFGGNSSSYQKRLKEINESVIEGIKNEVKKAGGNCGIDLRIENDEISAKGKSMIMVTAFATAVIIKEDYNTNTEQNFNEIDSEKYNVSKKLILVKQSMELNRTNFISSDNWQFFINNKLNSQFDFLINLLFEYSKNDNKIDSFYKTQLINYLSQFNKEDIENKFYSFLKNKERIEDYKILKSFINLLANESLYYINSTGKNLELMNSNNQLLFDCGFWLAVEELDTYNLNDVENYKKIISSFNNTYPVISPYQGSQLECSKCEGKITANKNRCKICGSDTRGIRRGDNLFDEYNTGDELIEVLEKRIEIIKQAFEI